MKIYEHSNSVCNTKNDSTCWKYLLICKIIFLDRPLPFWRQKVLPVFQDSSVWPSWKKATILKFRLSCVILGKGVIKYLFWIWCLYHNSSNFSEIWSYLLHYLRSLVMKWINFIPSLDKWSHTQLCGIKSIPKLQHGCDFLSMLGLKLFHVDKTSPKPQYIDTTVTADPLQRRHNERDGVSNHRRPDCLLIRLFRRRSKKTSKLRVTGLCEGNSPVTGEFPAQRASNAENVFIW